MSAGEVAQAYHLLSRAVRLMLGATFAAQVCLTVAGFEAVYLIWGFFAKRFTIADAEATAAALVFLSLGLAGWSAQTLISRGFYALGSTWPPTLLSTTIAVAVVPLYVSLREVVGEYGLAIASALAITIYVLSLGALQRLRFEREAAARAVTLAVEPGMLDGAVRLGLAAVIAIGLTLTARDWLLQQLPGVDLCALLSRGAALCALGLILYAALARVLGVHEIGELTRMAWRRLRSRTFA